VEGDKKGGRRGQRLGEDKEPAVEEGGRGEGEGRRGSVTYQKRNWKQK
jgi:hypothetical protein